MAGTDEIEDLYVAEWPDKWGFILDEYRQMQRKLDEITERSVLISKDTAKDPRQVAPIPNSVNHEYGWLAAKPEFHLEIYGPDVRSFKIPDIYQSL